MRREEEFAISEIFDYFVIDNLFFEDWEKFEVVCLMMFVCVSWIFGVIFVVLFLFFRVVTKKSTVK